MAQQLIVAAIFLLMGQAELEFVVALVTIPIDAALAVLAILYLKRRYHCDECGHRWRDPRHFPYSTLDATYGGASGLSPG